MEKSNQKNNQLYACIEKSVAKYLADLNGESTTGIYQMVLTEIEKPLLVAILKHTDNNQSKAAKALGISRTTLKKKLQLYKLEKN